MTPATTTPASPAHAATRPCCRGVELETLRMPKGQPDDTAEDRAVEEVQQVSQAVAALGAEEPRTQQAAEAEADDEPGRGEPGYEEDREENTTPAQHQVAPVEGVAALVAAIVQRESRDRGDMAFSHFLRGGRGGLGSGGAAVSGSSGQLCRGYFLRSSLAMAG